MDHHLASPVALLGTGQCLGYFLLFLSRLDEGPVGVAMGSKGLFDVWMFLFVSLRLGWNVLNPVRS